MNVKQGRSAEDGLSACWLCGQGGYVGRELRIGINSYVCVDAEACIEYQRDALSWGRVESAFLLDETVVK